MNMSEYPVLIADPSPEALEAMRDALQEIGLTVKTADSLEEVRRNLGEATFALVLISGHEFYATGTENLLSTMDGADPAPELLLVANDDDLEVATSLLERGTGDYLARPFTSNQLVAAVETGVVRFEVRQERAELEGQLDDVRRRFDEASDRQSQLVRSIDEKRDRILDELEEENKELRKKLQSAIQESSREAVERLTLVEDRLDDTQKECDRLHDECERLTEQLRIEREDHDKVLSEVQGELGEARRLLEESQRKQERQQADFESKTKGLKEQSEIDSRESRGQIRHLEETRDALQSQVEDLLQELTQAREARREAEQERRKVKDELMEEVSRLSEELQVRSSDSESYKRRHEDLERVHAESSESSRARVIELENERDSAKEEERRAKDNAERVRIRLERHPCARGSRTWTTTCGASPWRWPARRRSGTACSATSRGAPGERRRRLGRPSWPANVPRSATAPRCRTTSARSPTESGR
jgi:DNA-binding response OmpR family regulator